MNTQGKENGEEELTEESFGHLAHSLGKHLALYGVSIPIMWLATASPRQDGDDVIALVLWVAAISVAKLFVRGFEHELMFITGGSTAGLIVIGVLLGLVGFTPPPYTGWHVMSIGLGIFTTGMVVTLLTRTSIEAASSGHAK